MSLNLSGNLNVAGNINVTGAPQGGNGIYGLSNLVLLCHASTGVAIAGLLPTTIGTMYASGSISTIANNYPNAFFGNALVTGVSERFLYSVPQSIYNMATISRFTMGCFFTFKDFAITALEKRSIISLTGITNNQIDVHYVSTGDVVLRVIEGGSVTSTNIIANKSVNDSIHLEIGYYAGQLYTFINGVLVNQRTLTAFNENASINFSGLYSQPPLSSANGYFDEMYFYSGRAVNTSTFTVITTPIS